MKENSESGGIEDTFRRYDSVRLLSSLLLLPSCNAQVCLQGRVTTTLLLCLTSGTNLTSSSLPSTISASTSCELPHQLVLPLAEPSLILLLTTAVLNLSLAQHTANNLQHAYVLTGSQKVSPSHPPPHEWAIQAVHWCACLANSVGLVLTLVTLSSNCLQLTTSLLDGYVSGQVDQLLFLCAH